MSNAASSANDPTLDGTSLDTGRHATAAPPGNARGMVLVEGSSPRMADEIHEVLRNRLRAAALVLFAGYSVFWLLRALTIATGERPIDFVFVSHTLVDCLLGWCALKLCVSCPRQLWQLRAVELAVFGAPAVFFSLMEWTYLVDAAERSISAVWFGPGVAPIVGAMLSFWILLILTYALFVPNSGRRAAIVLTAFVLAAVVVLCATRWASPDVATAVSWRVVVSYSLTLIVSAVTAVYGVHTISSLRREAFEAKQLGQYRLREPLGAGGMGEVFLAEHQLLKRPCAIKVIRPGRATDPQALARFEREVRATAKLTHWNTVEIFDYGRTSDGTFYYVMEYLPGLTLGDLVVRHGPMPPGRVIHFLRQVCAALREAHARGLVHRDIKPGNIFAAERGGVYDVAKLLDFGLVKATVDDGSAALTQEAAITGSPLFMSPEQATGDHTPDVRGDIYSLGAVGYFLLTGRPPFEGDRPLKVLFAHVHEPVVRPSQYRSAIPADVEQVVLRCLTKTPPERYQSAEEMIEALSACESASTWNDQAAKDWWRSLRENGEDIALEPGTIEQAPNKRFAPPTRGNSSS